MPLLPWPSRPSRAAASVLPTAAATQVRKGGEKGAEEKNTPGRRLSSASPSRRRAALSGTTTTPRGEPGRRRYRQARGRARLRTSRRAREHHQAGAAEQNREFTTKTPSPHLHCFSSPRLHLLPASPFLAFDEPLGERTKAALPLLPLPCSADTGRSAYEPMASGLV